MATLTITDYLKYANLQMAAEAFIRDEKTLNLAANGVDLIKALIAGNGHTSRFTRIQAESFADPVNGWTVLDQRANMTSGFSGTLFKNNKTGELVMSFRSTEFIDDAVRDNLATNTYEIKNTGWAWGQISDMEEWYAGLKKDPAMLGAGQAFSVTGYSLGGHLATAFNLLHPDAAQQVVTFNGAGVGKVTQGTLADALDVFDTLRKDPLQIEARFTDPALAALYRTIRSHLADRTWTLAEAKLALTNANSQEPLSRQALDVWWALDEIDTLVKEAARVALLKAGGSGADADTSPQDVADNLIVAEDLDYRMAVKFAAQNTQSAWLVNGLVQAYGSKAYLETRLANQYDVTAEKCAPLQRTEEALVLASDNAFWRRGA